MKLLCKHFNTASKNVLLILFPLLTLTSNAANWVDLFDSETLPLTRNTLIAEIDLDSITQTSTAEYEVDVKDALRNMSHFTVKRLQINCLNDTALTLKATTDWGHGERRSTDYSNPNIDKFLIERRMSYPVYGQTNWKVIRAVCGEKWRDKESRQKLGDSVQHNLFCEKAEYRNFPFCKKDEKTIELLSSIGLRMYQVIEGCKAPSADVMRVLLGYGDSIISSCKDSNAKYCNTNNLYTFASVLESDLRKLFEKKYCTQINDAIEETKNQAKRNVVLQKFTTCTAKMLVELDDRVSPADVIASGAIGACQIILGDSSASTQQFIDAQKQALTGAVLINRRKAIKPPNKPKPKSSDT